MATPSGSALRIEPLLATCRAALAAAVAHGDAARRSVAALVAPGGAIDAARLDQEQFAAHGYAWTATYVEALRQLLAWAERAERAGRLTELEALILQAGFGEYLAQLTAGIALAAGEIARPADLGLADTPVSADEAAQMLIRRGNSAAVRERIAALIRDGRFGDAG